MFNGQCLSYGLDERVGKKVIDEDRFCNFVDGKPFPIPVIYEKTEVMITPHCKLSAASNNDPNIKVVQKGHFDVVFRRLLHPSLLMMEPKMQRFTVTKMIRENSHTSLMMMLTNWHFFICCFHMLLIIVIMA